MSTVVRLFLNSDKLSVVKSILTELELDTAGPGRQVFGSKVTSIFDLTGYRKTRSRRFPRKEQAILLASYNVSLNVFIGIYKSLKNRGITLLGILDPSHNDWEIYLRNLLR